MELTREEALKFFGIDENDDNVLLLPGSRKQEIAKMLEPMLEAAKILQAERKHIKLFLPVAPGIDEQNLKATIAKYDLAVKLCHEKTYDLMACCDFALATSGTVTLEAALMGLPSVVLYKMSSFTYRIAKLFVHVKFFSLPNILADKAILPELLQDEVNGKNIAATAKQLFKDEPSAIKTKQALKEVKLKLGTPGVAKRTANLILQTADKFCHKN